MISVLWQVTQQEEILEPTSRVQVRRPPKPASPATHTCTIAHPQLRELCLHISTLLELQESKL